MTICIWHDKSLVSERHVSYMMLESDVIDVTTYCKAMMIIFLMPIFRKDSSCRRHRLVVFMMSVSKKDTSCSKHKLIFLIVTLEICLISLDDIVELVVLLKCDLM